MYQDDSYTIKKMAHGDSELWTTLCPFAVSRQVRKELGIAISSDENYTWLVALDNESNTVAIAAVEFCNGSKAIFRHAYVVENHRGHGLYLRLLQLREKIAVGRRAVTTVNKDAFDIVSKAGYAEVAKRGKYTTMEKQL